MVPITTLYVVLSVVLFSVLSTRVIRGRRKHRILFGTGGNEDFGRLKSGHLNFAEYVPLTLIAIAAAELAGAHALLVHLCGAMLIIGRALHAYYFVYRPRQLRLRIRGMQLTFFAMWLAGGLCAFYTVQNYL